MDRSSVKKAGRRAYRWARGFTGYDGGRPGRSVVVFAPHPDDETLGCGGTIIKRALAGAKVWIVFMTDGSRSHPGLMPEAALRALRMEEASAASRALGAQEVVFLGFKDGSLSRRLDEGIHKAARLLGRVRPEEVFVPYGREAPPDHRATRRIARAALAACGGHATICEYPVWFWQHWPWTGAPAGMGRAAFLNHSLVSGLYMLKDLRFRVYVGDVLARKRQALGCHRSQMTRLTESPWPTLADVSGGDFLRCFFQDFELFYRYNF